MPICITHKTLSFTMQRNTLWLMHQPLTHSGLSWVSLLGVSAIFRPNCTSTPIVLSLCCLFITNAFVTTWRRGSKPKRNANFGSDLDTICKITVGDLCWCLFLNTVSNKDIQSNHLRYFNTDNYVGLHNDIMPVIEKSFTNRCSAKGMFKWTEKNPIPSSDNVYVTKHLEKLKPMT